MAPSAVTANGSENVGQPPFRPDTLLTRAHLVQEWLQPWIAALRRDPVVHTLEQGTDLDTCRVTRQNVTPPSAVDRSQPPTLRQRIHDARHRIRPDSQGASDRRRIDADVTVGKRACRA